MRELITSRKNPLLQQVKKLLSSRKEREATGLFVSDYQRLLRCYDLVPSKFLAL